MIDGPHINPSLVASLIAAQFPQWADLAIRPVAQSGWDNHTFHLGDAMLVRLPSAAHYAKQPLKEWDLLPALTDTLPIVTPTLLGRGQPGHDYPYAFSILAYLPGAPPTVQDYATDTALARDLAKSLRALYQSPATPTWAAGQHNFYRGGDLRVYDQDIRHTVGQISALIDGPATLKLWDKACISTWRNPPVWVHGDVAVGNMLVLDGKLSALIDFGSAGVGDPSCDLTIAWTFFDGQARKAFRNAIQMDPNTWARARGWSAWKACLEIAKGTPDAKRHLAHVLAD